MSQIDDNKVDCYEQSEANIPQKNEDSSQSASNFGFHYDPHNVWLRVDIAPDSPEFHIAKPKKTGRNTWKEFANYYSYRMDKTEMSCILVHFDGPKGHYFVRNDAERGKILEEMKVDLTEKLRKFMEKYPEAKMLWDTARIVRTEEGVTSPLIHITRGLVMNDTTFKHVYPNQENRIELKHPIATKNLMSNLTLKEFVPELANELKELKEFVSQGSITNNQIVNTQLMIVQLLKEMKPKPRENLWQKLRRFGKRFFHS